MSIRVEALRKKDIENYAQALVKCCDETKYLTGRPVFEAMEDQYFDVASRLLDPSHEVFLMVRNSDDKIIGEVVITKIDHVLHQGEFSIAIFCQNNFNKGYGTIALDYVLHYVFEQEAFHRLESRVFSSNKRAIERLTHAGFQVEGTMRQAGYVNDEYKDVVMLGILKSDYDAKK